MSVDLNNNIYIGGITTSTDKICTADAFQTTPPSRKYMGYLAKFNTSGKLLWGSYIGASSLHYIHVLPYDELLVTGSVYGEPIVYNTTFPFVTSTADQPNLFQGSDAFLIKLKNCFFSGNVVAGSNSPVKVGNNIILDASGGKTYSWSHANGFTDTAQNPVITSAKLKDSGTYTVLVTDSNTCEDTAHVQVTIQCPTHFATASSNSPVYKGQAINLSALGGKNYQWSHTNGFSSMSQNPFISNAQLKDSGIYTVIVTDSNTCKDTAQTRVVILDTATNVSAMANAHLYKLYPNPATETITLEIPANETGNFTLLNQSGQVVAAYKDVKGNKTIPVTAYSAGIYYYTITNNNQTIKTGKIVIQ